MTPSFTLYMRPRPEYGDAVLVLVRKNVDGTEDLAQLVWHRHKLRHVTPDEQLNLMSEAETRAMLQAVVDGAARLGVVPGDASTVLAAKDAHLADMRKIAFAYLEKGALPPGAHPIGPPLRSVDR